MNPILTIVLVLAHLSFIIVWTRFVPRRLSPWVRQKLGDYWNVTIKERRQVRRQSWEIQERHSQQQGCLVTIVQTGVDFGCMVVPIFISMAILIGIVMIVSGN